MLDIPQEWVCLLSMNKSWWGPFQNAKKAPLDVFKKEFKEKTTTIAKPFMISALRVRLTHTQRGSGEFVDFL